jgi:hypothetical protein
MQYKVVLVFNIGDSITTFDNFNLNEIESESLKYSHLNNNYTGSPKRNDSLRSHFLFNVGDSNSREYER